MKYFKCCAPLLLLFIHGTTTSDHDDNNNNENWIEPNAWGRAEHAGLNLGGALLDKLDKGSAASATKESCASTEDAVALIFYKKFIATLFNRKKLQHDEASSLYQRSLLFTISSAQLTQLEQLNDPRDLDVILTEILANARTPPKAVSGKSSWSNAALIWDIFKDLAQLLRTSEVRFLLVSLSAILLCWFLHRRYQVSLVFLIVGGVLLIGYFMTYLECNRKLEMEEMLEVLESEEQSLPRVESSWHSPLTKWFYTKEPVKQERRAKIKKHSKVNLGFCRPDHVLLMYANGLFMKQLEYLLEKCTETLVTLKDGLSFPYNFIAGGMLLAMIAYIVKLTFKYILSPSAWASLIYRPAATNMHHQQHSSPSALPNSGVAAIGGGGEDRISGENLKTLLNALTMPIGASVKPPPQAVSGVQEVLEQLEAGTASSSPSASSKSNSPNTSLEEQQQTPSIVNNSNCKEDAPKDAKA